MIRRNSDPLAMIEEGAYTNADLPSVLRACVDLGRHNSSVCLARWADLELDGYEAADSLPAYRIAPARLLCDRRHGPSAFLAGQPVPHSVVSRDDEVVEIRWPFARIADTVAGAVRRGAATVPVAPLDADRIITRVNEIHPEQQIVRLYWDVEVPALREMLDAVRIRLIDLVLKMRIGMLHGAPLGHDVVDHAARMVLLPA